MACCDSSFLGLCFLGCTNICAMLNVHYVMDHMTIEDYVMDHMPRTCHKMAPQSNAACASR